MKAYKCGISKSEFINEIKAHMLADDFIKGTYWTEDKKGCAVGCSLMSVAKLKNIKLSYSNHKEYENHLGIPEWLAVLEDAIFEGVSIKRSKRWPLEFSDAIAEGADLELIRVPFIVYVLEQNIKTQKENLKNITDNNLKQIIQECINVNKQMIKAQLSGNKEEIEAAESAAWSARSAVRSATWSAESARLAAWSAARLAAELAAWSAARSAAESAARSAAESAWVAAESAWVAAESARSAAESAWSVERPKTYEKYADKLLKLIKELE